MKIGDSKYNDGSDQENRYSKKILIISMQIKKWNLWAIAHRILEMCTSILVCERGKFK